jgi:cytochrome P450
VVSFYRDLTSHIHMFHRGIFHDETVYPDSHAFNPDRFLDEEEQINPSVPDPEHRVFGSGPRLASVASIKSLHFLTGA